MRNPLVVIVLLVLFGLVPISAWLAMAASLEPAGLGRSIGRAILVMLAPPAFGGLLMILGAAMLNRTRRAGRIYATVGAGFGIAGGLVFTFLAAGGYKSCGGTGCGDELIAAFSGALYTIAQIGLIVAVWRARREGSAASV